MKLKMGAGAGKFGAPEGMYEAKFVGVKEKEHPEYGPGLEWQFEVMAGEFKGQIVTVTTAPEPTAKNSCGRIIKGLTGGAINKDDEIEVEDYVGRTYQVMVETNSTGNGTRVGTVMPLSGPAMPGKPPTTPASRPAAPAVRSAPRPASSASVPAEKKFWVEKPCKEEGGEGSVVEMTAPELKAWIAAAGLEVEAVPVMAHDQSGGWQTAADFGFENTIPF